ncbi:DNA-methyltransferase [Methyloradius palustris]|uniref:Methyltransferase n=1 Tax=Methyloradius palustris TaxID=2778876 RepID=A0A8D5G4R9_9PROT|nr:site-specific DNA-methyltransferase [Methyloradius palustris]BCM25725.1 methyltransferase [Methyloradius palustris]
MNDLSRLPSSAVESIVSVLGSPMCRGANYAIYNTDCLEALNELPPELFDLVVTSPPYNIGKEYEKILSTQSYIDWCEEWIKAVHRVTKPDGAFWLNLGYISLENKAKAIPITYLLWDKIPFYLIQEVIWNYGAGVAAKKFLSPRNEKFLWYVKDSQNYTFNLDEIRDPDVKYPNQKKNGKLRCNTIGKNPSDVWQIAKITSGENRASAERTPHPAQFPLDLINRIVKGFSNPSNLLLDPFMGSGTTAESAIRNGRAVIGFEIRKDYCSFIDQRLKLVEAEVHQKPL